jgi:hypothetical protein
VTKSSKNSYGFSKISEREEEYDVSRSSVNNFRSRKSGINVFGRSNENSSAIKPNESSGSI